MENNFNYLHFKQFRKNWSLLIKSQCGSGKTVYCVGLLKNMIECNAAEKILVFTNFQDEYSFLPEGAVKPLDYKLVEDVVEAQMNLARSKAHGNIVMLLEDVEQKDSNSKLFKCLLSKNRFMGITILITTQQSLSPVVRENADYIIENMEIGKSVQVLDVSARLIN